MPITLYYNDDLKMAEYGRYCAVKKAIRETKEAVRDAAVRLGNSDVRAEAISHRTELNIHVDKLIEALEILEKP